MNYKTSTTVKKIQTFDPITEDIDFVLMIIESYTKDHYHVIVDSAYQDNTYEHLTAGQIKEKYNITL